MGAGTEGKDKMGKMLGACGLDCLACDAYKATATHDEAMKRQIAEKWSQAIGIELSADAIQCTGCMPGDHIIDFALECKIRICATSKNINNCSECADFPCKQLNEWHTHMKDEAKQNLLEAKASIR
ncbi:MAG TPA: DUF3795 domain-containing protein [Candidatus Cloacimonadota bacterium]|nr:DUF3795 domain-containing protein [Candidatus Cloacimonadota bacterium]HPT72194.1 DUF3795 domain-containing protein [Candidatus Cloacimonadota bacterium]